MEYITETQRDSRGGAKTVVLGLKLDTGEEIRQKLIKDERSDIYFTDTTETKLAVALPEDHQWGEVTIERFEPEYTYVKLRLKELEDYIDQETRTIMYEQIQDDDNL